MAVRTCNFAVIGAGIAGASAAYELAAHGSVVLLEREPLPGYHTTGRSAAFLVESYGNRVVQCLTRASREFLEKPLSQFALHPLLQPKPVLWIARSDQVARLAERTRRAAALGAELDEVDAEEAIQMCPVLRRGYTAAGVAELRAQHIDVAGLLDAFLRGLRKRSGEIMTRAEVTRIQKTNHGWEIHAGSERISADFAVNAAGAWAEKLGELAGARPIRLQPLRRTAITFDPPSGADIQSWPCVIDADEDFYLKPEGAQLLASPCDETPSHPCDAAPDDLGVALAADRVQRATTLELRHIRRRWAGLRTFGSDRSPVVGVDPDQPNFFWLAGQGGFGIMTSPATARAVASLITSGALPPDLKSLGLTPEMLSPSRPTLQQPSDS